MQDDGIVTWDDTYCIGRTEIDDVTVSTVSLQTFLPGVWETLIFGGPYDQHGRRYDSAADALAGHDAIVANLLLGRPPL